MSGDDVSELWEAVNDLREKQAEVLTELRSLVSMLRERCESRASTLADFSTRIKTLETNFQLLKIEQVRQGIYIALASSVGGSVISLSASWLLRKVGG